MKEYKNIYTGEKVNNIFESLGYKKIKDNKKIYIKYNDEEKKFNFETNKELNLEKIKFIVCTSDNESFDILFDKEVEGPIEIKIRSFANNWTYFKNAYSLELNKQVLFKYKDKELYFEIKK